MAKKYYFFQLSQDFFKTSALVFNVFSFFECSLLLDKTNILLKILIFGEVMDICVKKFLQNFDNFGKLSKIKFFELFKNKNSSSNFWPQTGFSQSLILALKICAASIEKCPFFQKRPKI
jgi:hypothetical protein